MRQIIVKFFALNYICNVFGKTVTFLRAANIIFPLMCLSGIHLVLTDTFSLGSFIGTLFLGLTLIAMFFGFYYFKLKPVKWEELDKSQKWQYGKYKTSVGTTVGNFKEWVEIDKEITEIYETRKFYNVLPLLVNIVVVIATVIAII